MQQLKDLYTHILTDGDSMCVPNRTGTDAIVTTGYTMRFDLRKGFPAVTAKKLQWHSVVTELLWFLRGDTNLRYLLQHGVHIWSDWPYKQYCEAMERSGEEPLSLPDYEERIIENPEFARAWGDLGPVYGRQWRYWLHSNGEITDQFLDALTKIVSRPYDRRIIVNAWNVEKIEEMALPPCHMMYQFHCVPVGDGTGRNYLDCSMYQRSCDAFLGVPFNIASYALLLHIVSELTYTVPRFFTWMGGNVHIYSDHVDQVTQYLESPAYPLPSLYMPLFKPDSSEEQLMLKCREHIFGQEGSSLRDTMALRLSAFLDAAAPDHFKLKNYQHGAAIPAPIAV